MDMFNRVVELVAVPDTSAVTTAQALLDNWVLRWGIPLRIHSDNGTAFANAIMEELAAKIAVPPYFHRAGSPRGQSVRGTVHEAHGRRVVCVR